MVPSIGVNPPTQGMTPLTSTKCTNLILGKTIKESSKLYVRLPTKGYRVLVEDVSPGELGCS